MSIFGYSNDDLKQAQREAQNAMVTRFKSSARHSHGHKQGREILSELIDDLRGTDPQRWFNALAEELVALIDHLAKQAHISRSEKLHRESLQLQLDEYQRNPLSKRIEKLTKARDSYQEDAKKLRKRVQQLEEALDRSRQTHQDETEELNDCISELNQIIVEQQQRLDAFRT
jgi:chromosome segregation ATPase